MRPLTHPHVVSESSRELWVVEVDGEASDPLNCLAAGERASRALGAPDVELVVLSRVTVRDTRVVEAVPSAARSWADELVLDQDPEQPEPGEPHEGDSTIEARWVWRPECREVLDTHRGRWRQQDGRHEHREEGHWVLAAPGCGAGCALNPALWRGGPTDLLRAGGHEHWEVLP